MIFLQCGMALIVFFWAPFIYVTYFIVEPAKSKASDIAEQALTDRFVAIASKIEDLTRREMAIDSYKKALEEKDTAKIGKILERVLQILNEQQEKKRGKVS